MKKYNFYIINQVDSKNKIYFSALEDKSSFDEAVEFAEKMMAEKGTPHFITTYKGIELLLKEAEQRIREQG